MGGQVVEAWVEDLLAADLLEQGATLLTISYRGNPLNSDIYRNGLIGLAKADLEFTTNAIHARLGAALEGRAYSVEGPAVVTEASGGIPGVPLYMALIQEVMGERFEDPTRQHAPSLQAARHRGGRARGRWRALDPHGRPRAQ